MENSSSTVLNTELMAGMDSAAFRTRQPFPWANPQYFIRQEHYPELLATLPDISEFRAFFGKQRKHGQASHDRYVLDFEEGMSLSNSWSALVDELRGEAYRDFVCELLNVSHVRFRFHWHFTPHGGEVSPHCDSKGKIGSQIFYLNTDEDWDTGWGGETVILDDGGRISADSAPSFNDFVAEYPAETQDNRCLIFGRKGNSWHGVRRIDCPEDRFRKVFIVVFEEHRPVRMAAKKLRRLVTGKELVTDKERLMY
ncbi:MAG: 2OG-Fe(II) oxygenase [Pseudomonadota bacterium]